MSTLRLAGLLFSLLWPFAAGAQLVVSDKPSPRVVNPADQVSYPDIVGCNNTLADAGARAVLGAIDRCPIEVFESRGAYYAYARQAVVGLLVPGATEAVGLLALDKARENALFCISGALIDASVAKETDRAFLTALLKEAKEISDRAELVGKLSELGKELRSRGLTATLTENGEQNSFVGTIDVQIRERQEGVGVKAGPNGQPDPNARSVEGELVAAGQARNDTPQARADKATAQARELARDCRYAEASAALAQAQQFNLAHLVELRADVARAKHERYCFERSAGQQRLNLLDGISPFLANSLRKADADIATAKRLDAEQTRLIGEAAELQQFLDTQRSNVDFFKRRAASQLETARQAVAQCDFARAASELRNTGTETLECALELDAERRAREELASQIEETKQQYAALDGEVAKIVATPFDQIDSCGTISIIADSINSIAGQCRTIFGVDAKVTALRGRARACGEFKTAAAVEKAPGPIPPDALIGTVTISPPTREDHGRGSSTESSFDANSSTWTRINGPDNRKVTVQWTYKGVPASLSPKDEITITVTGGVTEDQPPGSADGISLAGTVAIYGDVTPADGKETAENKNHQADRQHKTGSYKYVVNDGAQSVQIDLGGYPAGTAASWVYKKKAP